MGYPGERREGHAMNNTPWHAESWRSMLTDGLPALLKERMPLTGYRVDMAGAHAAVAVCAGAPNGVVEAEHVLPMPDDRGIFELDGKRRVVVPTASSDDLATASVSCAGERFAAYVAERLGDTPEEAITDADALRELLPLGDWARSFVLAAQVLDETNPLATLVHLRRIMLPAESHLFAPEHFGRVCPAEK
ncbi:MAG: hypothetical protein FJX72_00725, partial [Armatimonadetes bacterium]|nr:hypothetical protein [Armatimonadota bacterium]